MFLTLLVSVGKPFFVESTSFSASVCVSLAYFTSVSISLTPPPPFSLFRLPQLDLVAKMYFGDRIGKPPDVKRTIIRTREQYYRLDEQHADKRKVTKKMCWLLLG